MPEREHLKSSIVKPGLFNKLKRIASSPWFYYLTKKTGGLMYALAYKKLYLLAMEQPDLPFVEVGAAAGAGTIALARSYQRSGKTSPIIAVEKCEGGSRSDVGEFDDNYKLLCDNLKAFGVRDQVKLYTEYLCVEERDQILELIDSDQLAGFVLDADGHLDRDFELFWYMTIPGGLIVIDDYKDEKKYVPTTERNPDGGIKYQLTYRMLDILIEESFVEPLEIVGDTIFCLKPKSADNQKPLPHAQLRQVIDDVQKEYNAYKNTS